MIDSSPAAVEARIHLNREDGFPPYEDALFFTESLAVHDEPDPMDALYRAGFDAYTGVDTALQGAHTSAMLDYGYALMEHDDA